MGFGTIGGLIGLVAMVWVIYDVFTNQRKLSTGMKIFSNLKHFLNVPIPSYTEYVILPELAEQGKLSVFFADSWKPINTKEEYQKLLESN